MASDFWPEGEAELVALQETLGAKRPRKTVKGPFSLVCGVYVCFGRGGQGAGAKGDLGWAGAAVLASNRIVEGVAIRGLAGYPYVPGLLALREGPLLAAAISALKTRPDLLIVNGTGLDHPRGFGLAVHLGMAFDLPSIGVTWRPLFSEGGEPGPRRGDYSLLTLSGKVVAARLRVREGCHALVVHPGYGTDLETAIEVVLATSKKAITPEPLRQARRLARTLRAKDEKGPGPSSP